MGKSEIATVMTDFDLRLIEKAGAISRWDYLKIDALISFADTEEVRVRLTEIRRQMLDLVMETI